LKVLVKFFASHREYSGESELELELSDDATVATLVSDLFERFPKLKKLKDETIISVNKNYADDSTKLNDGDEVAFFPPVSGG
jgi:molybdopterin converting factor subunit 1